ncbi:FAD-dependent oxidoreductase [[Empedobacter] haloabium]|uniref:FAD-dependent oxidoreductase n=1 Tax=[Empedobacter] haloabium TaxID=592317 RepID=A0ABZ1UP30_9BURK
MNPTLHIVGSGPAGLAAAHAAVLGGAQVCLIDDHRAAGGQVWRGGPGTWNAPAADALWATLQDHPDFIHVRDTRVVGAADARTLLLESDAGGTRVPFERLLLCTGARERFVPFPGWTLPGVTGAGGLQALIKGGLPVRGRKVVVAGSGPLLLASATTALAAGAQVVAIVEHQPRAALARFGLGLALRHHDKLRQAAQLFAQLRPIPYLTDALVVEATGDATLRTIVVETARGRTAYDCDLLAAAFGLLPNTELGQAFGCAVERGALRVDERQQTTVPHIWAAGECTGGGGVDQALAQGRVAALHALGLAPSGADLRALRRAQDFAALLARHFAPRPAWRALCQPDTIVCRCEDVTAAELAPWRDWREAKLATRVGMGPCQGSTCAAACEQLFGWAPPAARIPILPARAATLASIE